MKRRLAGACAPLLALNMALASATDALPNQEFINEWQHVTVQELASSRAECRYFEVTTRIYNLESAPNSGIAGGYFMQVQRFWLFPLVRCDDAEAPGKDLMRFTHNDGWQVNGDLVEPHRARISATHFNCMGSCSSRPAPAERFQTDLTTRAGHLQDEALKGQIPYFSPAAQMRATAQQAAGALLPLMRPLLSGNCNTFFRESLDADARAIMPQDEFCKTASQMYQLLPKVLYDEPVFAFTTSIGMLHPQNMPLLFGGDDEVLVMRQLVLDEGRGKIGMHAILRRQADGGWRIWRLSP
jgi:hypothetical protein